MGRGQHVHGAINKVTGMGGVTSMSIMSLGKGTSGFSPVSTIGMSAFFISFSTNPVKEGDQEVHHMSSRQMMPPCRPEKENSVSVRAKM